MNLTRISAPEFDVELALAYATPGNLTGKAIYRHSACWLHPDAAAALARAIALAGELDLKFRIFDAYRPVEAQWALWRHNPDPDFLADPRRGSPHSRGIAIDLTLLRRADGTALDMGTSFDDFSERAFHNCETLAADIRRNRYLLLGLMASAGWDHYLNEWWHYQLYNPRSYPLLWDSAARTGLMTE
ncbi:MAG: D-alanyl-D-alanine dipeptidase [Rhodospirillaceae bacterium]|jgi:zinc D-Ala-D-Ala dipeptidase|nr:D-alanyl-D-alanine dipeptidase [Rhodospirillaceae bacterium]MBT4428362.1 D-alanyl-D-alanine dipeptidase [Rhodospirillaceae bacterium]MBT5780636.1 D-alanyl-D-alanine dipeptidase [Rhodospirillaceae bacterium]MBT6830184.1 D-alanyl-D-alanine dipeptidase [Rhodospirillaceae bacterium]